MLVLSLLFLTVIVVLVFSLTKDTGRNTIHARRQVTPFVTKAPKEQEEPSSITASKVLKAS